MGGGLESRSGSRYGSSSGVLEKQTSLKVMEKALLFVVTTTIHVQNIPAIDMNKLQASKGTIFRTKQPQKQMDHIDLGKGKRRMLSNEELKQRKRDHVGRMRYTSSILRQRQSAGEDDQKKGDVKKF